MPKIHGYPNGVRVLRIIEYVYENPERASEDQARWTVTLPAFVEGMKMRSTVLPFEAIDWVPNA